MPLYWINGGSGTGKSSALLELRQRGYETYDVDEAGPVTAKWHNIKTGYIHPKSSIKAHMRTPEFLEEHAWNVARQDVVDMAEKAKGRPIFLGGTIKNSNEITDLFAKTFALVVDNDTLKHRLLNRTNNDWGKSPHELKLALEWNKNAFMAHAKKGHIIIDAAQTVEKVVDEILSYLHED